MSSAVLRCVMSRPTATQCVTSSALGCTDTTSSSTQNRAPFLRRTISSVRAFCVSRRPREISRSLDAAGSRSSSMPGDWPSTSARE